MSSFKPRQQFDNHVVKPPYMPSSDEYLAALAGDDPVRTEETPRPRRRKPKRSLAKKIWLVILWALLLAVLGLIGYGGYIAFNVAKISTNPVSLSGLAADASGRTNILVLGTGDPGHSGEKLSDTVMVVSLDRQGKRVAQISLPRDLRVKIPGYGFGKINSANAYGGVQLASVTVSETLGIPVHYYVQTNFTGLKAVVDAVGGVDVNVKERLYDPEFPCADNQYRSCGLDIQPGLQHMDGTRALQYVRCRKGTCGNDFGRAARQQEVLNLVREKAVRTDVLLNPAELMLVVDALRLGVQTDMGAVQLVQLGYAWQEAYKNQPLSLVLSTSEGGYLRDAPGSSDLVPIGGDFDDIQSKVQDIFRN